MPFVSKAAAGLAAAAALAAGPARAESAPGSAHDIAFTAIDGAPMPLSDHRGEVLLVVNTASFCGYTRQYGGLQALYETYADEGLVVIGAPANDFGGQEPGSETEIKKFCETNFDVRFPLTEKVTTVGADAHPFYQWTAQALGDAGVPKWNFHKILIGRDGRAIEGFPSAVEPDSERLAAAVEAALAEPAEAPES